MRPLLTWTDRFSRLKARSLARRTAETRLALVHGDVSPKNILMGPRNPAFLDAECAWYGDPAFDLAFCLNHLLLKCLSTRRAAAEVSRLHGPEYVAVILEQIPLTPEHSRS